MRQERRTQTEIPINHILHRALILLLRALIHPRRARLRLLRSFRVHSSRALSLSQALLIVVMELLLLLLHGSRRGKLVVHVWTGTGGSPGAGMGGFFMGELVGFRGGEHL